MRLAPCAPVLARPDGSTQVGTARPVTLDSLSREARPVMLAAETIEIGGNDLAALGAVGQRLASVGLLVDEPRPPQGVVAIFGAGRVGLELGAALASSKVTIGFSDRRPAHDEPGLYPRRALAATCAGGASWAVRERHPDATIVDPSKPDLAVLIALGGAPRHVTARWEHDGLPHLLVTLDEAGATVGPLVVPGTTACGRCLALERTAEDPAWPALLDQLSSRPPRPVPGIVPDVVATASRMILKRLQGVRPSNEAWRIDLGSAPRQVTYTPRDDCGCGAARPLAAVR